MDAGSGVGAFPHLTARMLSLWPLLEEGGAESAADAKPETAEKHQRAEGKGPDSKVQIREKSQAPTARGGSRVEGTDLC